jgi:aminomethyltransferase
VLETAAAAPLPLARLHRRLGGRLAPFAGALAPADYGDPAREHAALREGCGLADRSWVARRELLGADRRRFLNGKITCDVQDLAPGAGAYGFVTNAQGRILADAVVLALEDRFRLELPPGRGEAIAEHLGRYVLADRVEVMPAADLLPLSLVGPRAEELLRPLTALPAEVWSHARASILGTEVTLVRQGRLGAPAFTLWVAASVAAALAEGLVERGAVPVGTAALEALRVEAGQPRFGLDFGPENFPQETGIEEAVSFTKGCYLGQEVVARIHYRGAVQRRLVGLRFAAEEPPPHGAKLLHDGREAGAVGSALRSPALGRAIGLAILHQRAGEPGTRVEVEGGGTAEVQPLPFVGI